MNNFFIETTEPKDVNSIEVNSTGIIDKKVKTNKEDNIQKPNNPSKKNKFENERNEIIKKLNNILGITETNYVFCLSDIDDDIIKQNQIISLVEDVKRYFKYSGWPYFSKELKDRKYLSLTKSIYKDMQYDMIPHLKPVIVDGKKFQRTNYVIMKKKY